MRDDGHAGFCRDVVRRVIGDDLVLERHQVASERFEAVAVDPIFAEQRRRNAVGQHRLTIRSDGEPFVRLADRRRAPGLDLHQPAAAGASAATEAPEAALGPHAREPVVGQRRAKGKDVARVLDVEHRIAGCTGQTREARSETGGSGQRRPRDTRACGTPASSPRIRDRAAVFSSDGHDAVGGRARAAQPVGGERNRILPRQRFPPRRPSARDAMRRADEAIGIEVGLDGGLPPRAELASSDWAQRIAFDLHGYVVYDADHDAATGGAFAADRCGPALDAARPPPVGPRVGPREPPASRFAERDTGDRRAAVDQKVASRSYIAHR